MSRWKPYFELDLLASGDLPPGWTSSVQSLLTTHGYDTQLSGDDSTGVGRNAGKQFDVRIVDGLAIQATAPWLWNLYSGKLLAFVSQSFGKQMYIANLIQTTVNINALRGRGAEYPWHVDTNTVTGVLYATDGGRNVGGSLIFDGGTKGTSIFVPKAGTFICFDAREIPHRVAPLRRSTERVSLPMNFYESATDQPRPPDLDAHIYTPKPQAGGA